MTRSAAPASASSAASRTARSFTTGSVEVEVEVEVETVERVGREALSVEETVEPAYPGVAGVPADRRGRRERVEAVESARPHVQLGPAAGLPDPGRVGDVLVPERLGRADVDEGRRQPGEVVGPGRRGV